MKLGRLALAMTAALLLGLAATANASVPRVVMIEEFDAVS